MIREWNIPCMSDWVNFLCGSSTFLSKRKKKPRGKTIMWKRALNRLISSLPIIVAFWYRFPLYSWNFNAINDDCLANGYAVVSLIRQTVDSSLSVISGIAFLAWKHPSKTPQDRSKGSTGKKAREEGETRPDVSCFRFTPIICLWSSVSIRIVGFLVCTNST